MKKIFDRLTKKKQKLAPQQELIEFVKDKQNIEKAAEGSMQKRNDLINRVNLRKQATHSHTV